MKMKQPTFPFLTLVIFVCNLYVSHCARDFISKYLGSKTPYRFVANLNTDELKYPGCIPKKIWTVNRHGTRYPKNEVISDIRLKLPSIRDDILKNHINGEGNLGPHTLGELEKWAPISGDVKEKSLTEEGADEMVRLSKRLKRRLPHLIGGEYDESKFEFRFTPNERANESARYFASGLFGEKVAKHDVDYIAVAKNDSILRFYKYCDYWNKYVKDNPMTYKELNLYIKSEEMNDTLRNITATLGYEDIINYSEARLMYQTCAFETSWTKNYFSPWCFVFGESNFQAMEYAEDVKFYWVDGYGAPITKKLACNLLKDVLQQFRNSSGKISTMSFCHSGTLLKTLIHLGLYDSDEPLKHDNRDKSRAWRTSSIDVFATNLAFVLYDCDGASKVLLLHQERPARFPECPNSDLCPLETIESYRNDSLRDCDLQKMCKMPHDEF